MRKWKKNARNEKSGAEEKNTKRRRWKENRKTAGRKRGNERERN